MKINKWLLYIFGTSAVIFTVLNIINIVTLFRDGTNVVWWSIVFMWPLNVYGFLNFVFHNLSTFFLGVPFLVYLRIIVAMVSPFLAMAAAGQFGYPRALWFILALIFPFILVLIAIRPPSTNLTPNEKKKLILSSVKYFLIALFLLIIGLWPSNGNVVYVVGARWINSENVFGQIFAGFTILLGFLLIPFGILEALGIIKTYK